jgi:hypothetical protein
MNPIPNMVRFSEAVETNLVPTFYMKFVGDTGFSAALNSPLARRLYAAFQRSAELTILAPAVQSLTIRSAQLVVDAAVTLRCSLHSDPNGRLFVALRNGLYNTGLRLNISVSELHADID